MFTWDQISSRKAIGKFLLKLPDAFFPSYRCDIGKVREDDRFDTLPKVWKKRRSSRKLQCCNEPSSSSGGTIPESPPFPYHLLSSCKMLCGNVTSSSTIPEPPPFPYHLLTITEVENTSKPQITHDPLKSNFNSQWKSSRKLQCRNEPSSNRKSTIPEPPPFPHHLLTLTEVESTLKPQIALNQLKSNFNAQRKSFCKLQCCNEPSSSSRNTIPEPPPFPYHLLTLTEVESFPKPQVILDQLKSNFNFRKKSFCKLQCFNESSSSSRSTIPEPPPFPYHLLTLTEVENTPKPQITLDQLKSIKLKKSSLINEIDPKTPIKDMVQILRKRYLVMHSPTPKKLDNY